jgi:DNA-binding NarL/FixJ family response regulator
MDTGYNGHTGNGRQPKATRILIADDQPQVRSALRVLLMQEPDLVVVGEAVDTGQALELAAGQRPDLVLLDWELPDQGGAAALAGLREVHPGLAVIALSGKPEAQRAALAAGVDAFVSKGKPPEYLMASVDKCRHRQRT